MDKEKYIAAKNNMSGKRFGKQLSACLDRQYHRTIGMFVDDVVVESECYWDDEWEDLFVVTDIKVVDGIVRVTLVNHQTGEIREEKAADYEPVHETEVLNKYKHYE